MGDLKETDFPLFQEAIKAPKMSDSQVALRDNNAVALPANTEFESEAVEETTLSETHKDLGHTKVQEKTATFESQETTSEVSDTKQKQTESNRSVMQSETMEMSGNRQVKTSSFETSQSFSMEETEEYEIEG